MHDGIETRDCLASTPLRGGNHAEGFGVNSHGIL